MNISAQMFEDIEETEWTDQYPVRSEQKSASTAILLSSLFPGSGHLYANPKSVGTFLFPILEVGFWVGYFYYNNKGSQIEKDYMAYADENYDREKYYLVRDLLINHSQSASLYNKDHFRLDETNTQHFYEDIGKYNKYIFGWHDWFARYVSETGEVYWQFSDGGVWLGNRPINPDHGDSYEEPYSELRAKYIRMRRDAQEHYDISYLMSFGLAANRIASSIDASRLTQKYNRELRYSYNVNFNISPMYSCSKPTPTLSLSVHY